MITTEHSKLLLEPAPGLIVGRQRQDEPVSEGGILLPPGIRRLPIMTVVRDGGPPTHECERCAAERERWTFAEGDEVVVAGMSQVLDFGGDDSLFLVPYSAIVAKVRWIPKENLR